jgi:myo-inositol-1(or 4)-monophosphatase
VSIALVLDGEPVVGVVHNPATDELYRALRGGGAVREHAGGALRASVRIPAARPLLHVSRNEVAAGEDEPFRADYELAVVGSTAYKLARVAAGVADGFVSRGPKSEWDVAAGVLLVREAGGRATELNGARLRFNKPLPEVAGIVAAGGVYDRLSAIARALPPLDRLRRRPADALHPGLEGRDS